MTYFNEFNVHFYSDREEFDEEKEPDGMLLSGWTQASPEEKDDNKSVGNGVGASDASKTAPVEVDKNNEMGSGSGKKRKLPEVSEAAVQDCSNVNDKSINHKRLELVEDDDDFLMLDEEPGIYKKKKLQ